MATPANPVPVKEVDFLDEDPPIRNQNYACVSFLSPEAILKDKHLFLLSRFLSTVASDVDTMLKNLEAKYSADSAIFKAVRDHHDYLFDDVRLAEQYRFYLENKADKDEQTFHEQKNFQTSVRGFKLRGTYDTLKEAQVRSEVLKRSGDRHAIFICQVGMWCPWDPNPNAIEDSEYSETQLNTLMKAYRENDKQRDVEFDKRKTEAIAKDVWVERQQTQLRTGEIQEPVPDMKITREASDTAIAEDPNEPKVYTGEAIASIKI